MRFGQSIGLFIALIGLVNMYSDSMSGFIMVAMGGILIILTCDKEQV
ncbi:MAG: hypothetical protein KAJ93_01025 [Methanosarcinales archaeon]|nr:hypothetical protein [Methanosarcinales archaeon]